MYESILGALLIMFMRICDVSIGTMRTILVVQGKKYYAGLAGMIEVLIWVFAIRYIFQNLDEVINLFGYAIGFGIGNILGITIEQKIGLGFAQLNIISRTASEKIIEILQKTKVWCNCSTGTGSLRTVIYNSCYCTKKISKEIN